MFWAACLSVGWMLATVGIARWQGRQERERLLRLDRYLHFGQSLRSVARLTGGRLEGPSMVVDTELEFGAKNWTMLLEFDARQRLRAVRYRCPDGVTVHPHDAPPDREDKAASVL